MDCINEFGQPIGREVAWTAATRPEARALAGRFALVEPLQVEHVAELFHALREPGSLWTYLSYEPPADIAAMTAIVNDLRTAPDWQPFVVRRPEGPVLGTLSYLRIQPSIGTIEVGGVIFGASLQRTPAATEAQFLLMRHAFDDLGYRRYEWKCDSLNAPSRRAAARLGFIEEGTWRNALTYKGRNRDTTWFSITDDEWPAVKAAFEAWLADENFDADGNQRASLRSLGTIAGT